MPDDWELLEQFRERGSQDAFAQLVRRHAGLVYHACRRRLRDPQLAEDVSQAVFVLLARRGPVKQRYPTLAGWLYRTAHHACANAARARARRAHYERVAAQLQSEMTSSRREADVDDALLEEAMSQLAPGDRDLLVMRFYEDRDVGELGRSLGIPANTAAKRLSRAVSRLRNYLASRGQDIAPALVGPMLAQALKQSAPVTLTSSATAAALAAAASPAVETIVQGVIQMLIRTKAKLIATTVGIVVLGCAMVGVTVLLAQTPPAAKPQSAATPATQPAAASANPRQVMKQFAAAIRAGDATRARELVQCNNRDEEILVGFVCDYISASAELKKAVASRFGAGGAKQMEALFQLTPVDQFAGYVEQNIEKSQESIAGDEAILQPENGTDQFILTNSSGQWKISAARMTETWTPEQWQSRSAEIQGAAEMVQMLAQKVNEGAYASVDELKREIGSYMNQRR